MTLNGQGYRLLQQSRFAEAEPVLRKSIAMRPSQPTYAYALYNLGWSLMGQGRVKEAVEPLRRSAEMQPGRRDPKRKLAEAYELLGQEDRAAEIRGSLRSSVRTSRPSTRRSRKGTREDARAIPLRGPTVRLADGGSWLGSTRPAEERGLREERTARLAVRSEGP